MPPSLRIRVGIDILAVERVSRLLRENAGIEDEVFTARELEYCARRARPDEHLAARFAAKEAVLKAIGTGARARTALDGRRDPSRRWPAGRGASCTGGWRLIAQSAGHQRASTSRCRTRRGLAVAQAAAVAVPRRSPVRFHLIDRVVSCEPGQVRPRPQAHLAQRGVLGGDRGRAADAPAARARGAVPGRDLADHDHDRAAQARGAALDRLGRVPRPDRARATCSSSRARSTR